MLDAAQQSDSFLQLILDSLPMPLFVVDAEYRLVDWNPAAKLRLLSVEPSPLLAEHGFHFRPRQPKAANNERQEQTA